MTKMALQMRHMAVAPLETGDQSPGADRAATGSSQFAATLLEVQPHQDIMIVIAKTAAENVDPSGVSRIVADADPQPDRVVFGELQLRERHRRKLLGTHIGAF